MRVSIVGEYEEILQIVYDTYYRGLKPTSFIIGSPSLFDSESIEISSSETKKVADAMKEKFEKNTLALIKKAYLSEIESVYFDIYRYIMLAFKEPNSLKNINLECVKEVEEAAHKTSSEAHKLKGYLRFQELEDGSLFSIIEPKHNIIALLADYFKKRLPKEEFIILDRKRELAYIKSLDEIVHVQNIEQPTLSDDEKEFQHAWRSFFTSISIESRKNLSLQRQKVPLYLREFMTEFG